MAAYDWTTPEASEGNITVEMISQNNLTQSYGLLHDINLSTSTVEADWDSDTKTSGSLTVYGDEWVRGSFLRIAYEIPQWEYKRYLGTYVVVNDPSTYEHGHWSADMTLHSAGLYTLSTHHAERPLSISKNASAKTAIRQILNNAARPYIDQATVDYTFGSVSVLESGTSMLKRILAIANNVLDIDTDGRGYVTISNYVPPRNRASVLTLDLRSNRSVSFDDLRRTSDFLSVPGRAIVSYRYSQTTGSGNNRKTVEYEITGVANATGITSPNNRGYVISDFQSLNELKPATQARANQLALERIKELSAETVTWNITTTYLPIWEGDVITLNITDGDERYQGSHKCLVQNLDMRLDNRQMRLKLLDLTAYSLSNY